MSGNTDGNDGEDGGLNHDLPAPPSGGIRRKDRLARHTLGVIWTVVTERLKTIQANALRASTLLKAMSNQHRLMILCQLVPGEKCVSDLEEIIGLSQSALSQHLARLRRDNLVQTRREAQTIFYSLAGEEASAVIETLYGLYCGQDATLTANDDGMPKVTAI